jgi:hypothetical protein
MSGLLKCFSLLSAAHFFLNVNLVVIIYGQLGTVLMRTDVFVCSIAVLSSAFVDSVKCDGHFCLGSVFKLPVLKHLIMCNRPKILNSCI